VYPKSRAIELAKVTNEPVLFTPIELETAPIEDLKTAPVQAVKPTGEEVQVTEVVEIPPEVATAKPVEVAAAQSLPKTASTLPLVGLIGLLSLGVGLALSVITKQAA